MSATVPGAVFDAVEAGAAAATELLRMLVAAQARGEVAVQDIVATRLDALGGEVRVIDYAPHEVPVVDEFATATMSDPGRRQNVVARFAPPPGTSGRSLLLFAHPDSEPTDTAGQWTVPAFTGDIREGRMHGWGIADDLAGLAIGIAALEALAGAGIRIAGEVILASTPSKRHARGIAAVLHSGIDADAALYLHPAESGAGLHEIKAMASGQLEFMLTVRGRRPQTSEPGHTAFVHLGVNPLDPARHLITAIERLAADRAARIRHPLLEAAVGRATNIMLSSLRYGDGVLSQLPETLQLGGAIAFPPGETMGEVQAEFEAAIAEASAADPWLAEHPVAVTWLAGVSASEVAESHAFFEVVAGAIETACGYRPRVNAMHTSSDIRNPLVQKAIPTLGIGPLCGNLTHSGGIDEWVDHEDLLRAIKAVSASIVIWCGVAA